MKIACICCTYNRPQQLAEAIESFQRQTYPLDKRELIVLDDAGQYNEQTGPGWWLLSVGKRFRTLGEKRNATAALASADVDAYAVWDDDDIYLPWHLEAMARVFESGAPWSVPDEVWIDRRTWLERKRTGGLFHGSWGFTREAFLSVGGYPPMQSGQDQALAARFRKAGVRVASLGGVPSYVYRWFTYENARHISALGKDGYERRGQEPIVRREVVVPGWGRDWEEISTAASAAAGSAVATR
ncbi:MAG: glycosyltransferase family 2 protein [Candidatus Nealsonbacteria bacterium]|nr:glycosyltransferase family 2 protein [Candidatus Nealsonbacteria bacterium]